MRLFGLISKEFSQIIRDKGFILTAILEPIVFVLIFGYGFGSNIEDISTTIIDYDNTNYSKTVIDAINGTDYLKIEGINKYEENEAKKMVNESKIRNLIIIPKNFQENLDNGKKTHLVTYIDSSDYFIYSTVSFGLGEVMKDTLDNVTINIIGSLEEEKEEKKEEFDEIKKTVNDMSPKIDNVLSKFGNIAGIFNDNIEDLENLKTDLENGEIDNLEDGLNSIEGNISLMKSSLQLLVEQDPSLADSLTPVIAGLDETENSLNSISSDISSSGLYNLPSKISEFKTDLEKSGEDIDEIDSDVDYISEKYNSVKQDVNSVTLELKNLKKEFLSLPIDLEDTFVYDEITYFEYLVPGIASLIIFFIAVVSTANNIIDEKDKKTFQRVMVTPLRKTELFLGKFFVFFFIGCIEAIYVMDLIFLFGVDIWKNFWSIFAILVLLVACSVAIGLFISSLIKSTRQGMMIIPLVIIPSILITGIFSPLDPLPEFIKMIGKVVPIYYSTTALREIMIKGTPLLALKEEIIALIVTFFNMLILTLISFKLRES